MLVGMVAVVVLLLLLLRIIPLHDLKLLSAHSQSKPVKPLNHTVIMAVSKTKQRRTAINVFSTALLLPLNSPYFLAYLDAISAA